MDPIFEHPVFDSAKKKINRFIRQHEKLQEVFENSLYTCFKCGAARYFLLQIRSDLLTKGRLCSMSAVIATINGERDHATNLPLMNHWGGCPQLGTLFI